MKLYLASGNAHKAAELQTLAKADGLSVEIISARAVGGMPAVEEDTGTFIGNARKKALALRTKLPAEAWALADDSGLCVDVLGAARRAWNRPTTRDSWATVRPIWRNWLR